MMNIGLFETCWGKFKWNKLTKKSVHLVGLSNVYVSRRTVQNMKKRSVSMHLHNLQGAFSYIYIYIYAISYKINKIN